MYQYVYWFTRSKYSYISVYQVIFEALTLRNRDYEIIVNNLSRPNARQNNLNI
jgi:hypothetical protein